MSVKRLVRGFWALWSQPLPWLLLLVAGAIAINTLFLQKPDPPTASIHAKHDGRLSAAQCRGLDRFEGQDIDRVVEVYGLPDNGGEYDPDFGQVTYALRDDKHLLCDLSFDLQGHLGRVTMDLWDNGEL